MMSEPSTSDSGYPWPDDIDLTGFVKAGMTILANGINHRTHSQLIDPVDKDKFAEILLQDSSRKVEEMRKVERATKRASTFEGKIERRVVDLDPVSAGWTFLINENDPQRDQIINAINPLAVHRGMADTSHPLIFSNQSKEEWLNWLTENYHYLILEGQLPPHYILIVGGPDKVPFHFQSLLATAPSVGRIDFDSINDLKTYVEKVIRLEKASSTTVSKQTLFFAPNAGWPDATYYINAYMAQPLSKYVNKVLGFETQNLIGSSATKKELLRCLQGSAWALVYTASHGLEAKNESLEEQKRLNGAICCQRSKNQKDETEWVMTADDIPDDRNQPFLPGSIFFQFGCLWLWYCSRERL